MPSNWLRVDNSWRNSRSRRRRWLGGLPVAVEVTIGIDPAFGLDEASTDVSEVREAALADMSEYMYRLVIRLPTARPLPLDEESLETGNLEAVGL